MCVPNIKKETKSCKPGKQGGKDPPTACSSAPQLLHGHVCLPTLKRLFFKKLVAFYTAIQSS